MASLTVTPLDRPPRGSVELPGASLSSALALTASALADGTSTLSRFRADETTRTLGEILRSLGVAIEWDESLGRVCLRGCSGHLPEQEGTFEAGPNRLAAHLAVALCSLGYGDYRIQAGPVGIGATADALHDLGADIGCEEEPARCPVTVRARGLAGGRVRLDGPSPETLAALLIAAPYARQDVFVEVVGRSPALTAQLACTVMRDFDVAVVEQDDRRFIVAAPQRFRGRAYGVAADPFDVLLLGVAAVVTGGRSTWASCAKTVRRDWWRRWRAWSSSVRWWRSAPRG